MTELELINGEYEYKWLRTHLSLQIQELEKQIQSLDENFKKTCPHLPAHQKKKYDLIEDEYGRAYQKTITTFCTRCDTILNETTS